MEVRVVPAADPLPVFSTGLDSAMHALAAGATDPHYAIVATPSGATTAPSYVTKAGYPFGSWAANAAGSSWLSPHANENANSGGFNEPVGRFTYRTTVDLAGFDPASASITGQVWADNTLVRILVNGQAANYAASTNNNDFAAPRTISLTGGFGAGVNTIDFVINNWAGTGVGRNPSGFRAVLAGTALRTTTTTLAASAPATTYGQAATLTATVSSGLGTPTGTVTFKDGSAVLGTATLAGGTATLSTAVLTAGDHSITATYSGAESFAGGTSSAVTRTVNKVPLTVTVGNAGKVYGAANPSVGYALSGFVNGETPTTAGVTGAASASTPATAASPVGNYAITATAGTLNAANYAFTTFVPGSLSVTPATLTVTATGLGKTYDGSTSAGVTLSANALNGDTLVLGYGSAAFAGRNAGTGKAIQVSDISVTGAAAGNYVFNTSATASADVTARTLNVVAVGVDRVYDGTTTASVTFTDDRLAGDVLSVGYTSATFLDANVGVGKAIVVNGIALAGPAAGNYVVTPSASGSASIAARDLVWNYAGDGEGSGLDPANWDGANIPGANDNLVFGAGKGNADLTGLGTGITFAGMAIQAGYTGTIRLPANLTIGKSGLKMADGAIVVDGSLDLRGDSEWSGGSIRSAGATPADLLINALWAPVPRQDPELLSPVNVPLMNETNWKVETNGLAKIENNPPAAIEGEDKEAPVLEIQFLKDSGVEVKGEIRFAGTGNIVFKTVAPVTNSGFFHVNAGKVTVGMGFGSSTTLDLGYTQESGETILTNSGSLIVTGTFPFRLDGKANVGVVIAGGRLTMYGKSGLLAGVAGENEVIIDSIMTVSSSTAVDTVSVAGKLTISEGGTLKFASAGLGVLHVTSDLIMDGRCEAIVNFGQQATVDRINVGGNVQLGGELAINTVGQYAANKKIKFIGLIGIGAVAGQLELVDKPANTNFSLVNFNDKVEVES